MDLKRKRVSGEVEGAGESESPPDGVESEKKRPTLHSLLTETYTQTKVLHEQHIEELFQSFVAQVRSMCMAAASNVKCPKNGLKILFDQMGGIDSSYLQRTKPYSHNDCIRDSALMKKINEWCKQEGFPNPEIRWRQGERKELPVKLADSATASAAEPRQFQPLPVIGFWLNWNLPGEHEIDDL